MKKKIKEASPFKRWGNKIDWAKRVKAVCKPCWEIKYCPYGPLVEKFPIKANLDERSCRIFGHQCPVFFVAEPLTETKELRNISRKIPRTTQFRVLKRENQICAYCGNSVKDDNIEFDHIIPWSKGGSSDEHNIRLLCSSCNRKRGKKFEDSYLVGSVSEHLREPVGIGIISVLAIFIHLFHDKKGLFSSTDICRFFGRRKVRVEDEKAIEITKDIVDFFNSKKPLEITEKVFKAMKYRWGFLDAKLHTVKDTIKKYNITNDVLLSAETSLINRLGWYAKLTDTTKKTWLKQDNSIMLLIDTKKG